MTQANKLKVFTIDSEEYQALQEDYCGFCRACGETAFGVEPDARKYVCESCNAPQVYGLEELLIMGMLTVN